MLSVLSLNGHWQVSKAGEKAAVPATVPGSIHNDLLQAKRIPDPYYRDNEGQLLWIGEADWVYAREFDADDALLAREHVLLRCKGLDTIAAIRINGRLAGRADNMFRTWEFDVKRLLRTGRNTIEVHFSSALRYCSKRNAARRLPAWGVGSNKRDAGSWIRKEPCNFGWDWGPDLVTCGIWRDIELVGYDAARIADVHVRQQHARGRVGLRVAVSLDRTDRTALRVAVRVLDGKRSVAEAEAAVRGSAAALALAVKNPKLWWPNGLGGQPLYRIEVCVTDAEGRVVDAAVRRVGLRTLELVRRKDRWGESFMFACNGKAFFAKGANWIPAEAILPRLTYDDYWRLVGDAAAANMNMLRVWGGGIYEDDRFYDLCDELGICIWQDFMFACGTYPAFDAAWMANVESEARDNIRRLRHHPCLALWCGNNELEQGLVGETWTAHAMSWEDYGRLFDRLLPDAVKSLDPDTAYWPCSPHSPHGERKNFNDPRWGDAHLWDVWHGRKPFEWYRTCEHRFNSEFGFQSFPEPRTVRSYTAPGDRNVTSPVMEWHQRSGIGNTVIMQYMLDWFRIPKSFDLTLWMSQVLHGMAMKYAVEHWRRSMPRGMGTLYWQINDCWPVASWASIDGLGRWKALHYMARHFYAPVLISAVEDKNRKRVDIHVTNDLPQAFAGSACWRLTTADGRTLASDVFRVKVAERSTRRVLRVDLAEPLARYGERNLLVWLELRDKSGLVSENLATFCRPKQIDWQDPAIRVAVRRTAPGRFAVRLTSARPALWTWLELKDTDARYSDNFFHLAAKQARTVELTADEALSAAEIGKRLVVRSLVNTYA